MKQRETYILTPQDDTQSCLFPSCSGCEFCDIELVPLERKKYIEMGSRWWRLPDGTPVKKQGDNRNLICTLTGLATTPEQACPLFREADVLWK